jgi:cysteine desulfuration protein SufE
MATIPDALADIVSDMESITDRNERAELLIETADRFGDYRVPEEIAAKPYPESHRVPACESDAYVWAADRPDGTLDFYFDVLNPQGLSAMAMSTILAETLNGQPLDQVAAVSSEIVFKLFGKDLSMGKGAGLMGIVSMVQAEAKKRLAAQ